MKKYICKKCGKEFEWHRKRSQCTDCIAIRKKYNSKEEQLEARKKQLSNNVIERRKRNKLRVVNMCGEKCCICGYDRCKDALEFHHVNENEKEFGLANKLTSYSWNKVKEEVKKTIMVCANCHREIHKGFYTNDFISYKHEENQQKVDYFSAGEQLLEILTAVLRNKIENEPKQKYIPKRKVIRPETYEQFVKEMDELKWNYSAMGRKYGVSDNAIRKWQKGYNK